MSSPTTAKNIATQIADYIEKTLTLTPTQVSVLDKKVLKGM